MTKVKWEELWEPWYLDELPYEGASHSEYEIPSDVIARFGAAKAEMEAVWLVLNDLIREQEDNTERERNS